jgi:hypothetical protein
MFLVHPGQVKRKAATAAVKRPALAHRGFADGGHRAVGESERNGGFAVVALVIDEIELLVRYALLGEHQLLQRHLE